MTSFTQEPGDALYLACGYDHCVLTKRIFDSNQGFQSNIRPTSKLMSLSNMASNERLSGEQPRIMDKTWEVIQKKTFTNWINNKLKIAKVSPITDIDVELCSGEKLIQLLEVIGDESLGKYNKAPKLRLQRFENMNTALSFIKRRGVGLTNIGAEDIVDGNVKLILGLIWSIILRFTIADISEEGLTAKEGLLLWVQKRFL